MHHGDPPLPIDLQTHAVGYVVADFDLLVGLKVASRASSLAGVAFWNSNSHSKSWRGSPVQAQTRCLMSTCFVVSGSPSLKSGMTAITGVSHVSLPSSTSVASNKVVIDLVLEATMKSVSASTGVDCPCSRTPKPPSKTTWPSW